MNKTTKFVLFTILLSLAILTLVGCDKGNNPYPDMNDKGFTVSVKYDANGGTFATNTSVIVDSYNYDKLPTDSDGNKYVSLIAPEDEKRGEVNAYMPINNGYFLAGWYAEREAVYNDDGTVATYADGTPKYTYGARWDFKTDTLSLGAKDEYRAGEAVVTLYAAWVPNFSFAFYTVDGEPMLNASGAQYTTTINPLESLSLTLPAFGEDGGKMNYGKFPEVSEMTFSACYLGENKTDKVEGTALTHLGSWNPETAAADNVVTKVYVEYTEGVEYHIYTAKQLCDLVSMKGRYEICADLDFSKRSWPTAFAYGNFQGQINGNGYTISNVTFNQNNAKTEVAGLFGRLTSQASISNLNFDNIIFNANKGTTLSTISLGIVAGVVDAGATLDGVTLKNSTLVVSDQFNVPETYAVALVLGEGEGNILSENVTFTTTDDTSLYTVEVTLGNDGMLTIVRTQNY